MTKWKSGDTPCWMCEKDWYDEDEENIDEHLIGTYTYPECGDGCCWNRAVCEECGGTGKEGCDDLCKAVKRRYCVA